MCIRDSIYSGAKTSALNTTRGFYLGSDGQVGFGDTNEYIQFYKGDDGNFHLRISAGDILFGKSKKTVESAITAVSYTHLDLQMELQAVR